MKNDLFMKEGETWARMCTHPSMTATGIAHQPTNRTPPIATNTIILPQNTNEHQKTTRQAGIIPFLTRPHEQTALTSSERKRKKQMNKKTTKSVKNLLHPFCHVKQ